MTSTAIATNYTGAKKLVADFMGADLMAFYTNAYSGTEMVEYRAMGRIADEPVLALGRRIMKYKKMLAAGRVF